MSDAFQLQNNAFKRTVCICIVVENDTISYALLFNRGGVENTRLEAKDTKKIQGQGQGQPFRGQTLSRLRTGMLEAKDQGHSHKCSPKKTVFNKVFQAISNS